MSEQKNTSGNLLGGLCCLGFGGVVVSYLTVDAERFWTNWLFWYLFLLTIGLGALFIVAIEHLVNARWSVPVRRSSERLSGLVLFAAPIAVLALFSIPVLYPWASEEGLQSKFVAGKAPWLNVRFFVIRVLVCVGLWALSYRILVGGSLRQDVTRDPQISVRLRRFAPLFMVIFAITVTLVAFDWVSSLEPEWYSDIFGVYVFAGCFLAGLAATTLVVLHLMKRGRLPGIRFDHLYNLGGFLFAFTVFWSYIGFAQYMLIWYANLPEEVLWYQRRIEGPWLGVALALALFHFFIPFFALVTRDSKGDPTRLRWVAALVLVAHALDLYWLVFPVVSKTPPLGWPELFFAFFFVPAALLWIRRAMRKGADLPVGDPFLKEGLEFRL